LTKEIDANAYTGNWRGVYGRLWMWAVDGTWERVLAALVAHADADEDLSWAVSVDSALVRAHQHAAETQLSNTKGIRNLQNSAWQSPADKSLAKPFP
jgi:hypothetical protein